MSFSARVGQEPASDLKKRMQSLCEEAGLEVVDAQGHLIRVETMEGSFRIVHVWAREPGWTQAVAEPFKGSAWEEHATYQLEVTAQIGVDGTFSGSVRVACCACAEAGYVFHQPTLRNGTIALSDLPAFLVKVVKQQGEIIAARKGGKRQRRYVFGDMVWEEWH